jgi:hypothetical protein
MISKEKMKDIFFYLCIASFAITVWYISYNIGVDYARGESIQIGQEYIIKDINIGPNSSFIIVYYDNDKNKTERMIVPSNYNVFNFTESNSNTSIMKLNNTNGGVNYWNVFTPKK